MHITTISLALLAMVFAVQSAPDCSSSSNTYCMHCDEGGNRRSCVASGVECTTYWNGNPVTVQLCSSLATTDGSAGSGGCFKFILSSSGNLLAFYSPSGSLPSATCPTACTDATKSGNMYCAMCDPNNNRQTCLSTTGQECMTSYWDTQGSRTVPVVMKQCGLVGNPTSSIVSGGCYPTLTRNDGVPLTLHPAGSGVDLVTAQAIDCAQQPPLATPECSSSAAQGNTYCMHCDGGGNRLSCVALGVECTTTYDGAQVTIQLCSSLSTSDGSAGSGGCSKLIALPTGGLFAFYTALSSLPTTTCPTACTDATKSGNTYCAMCDPNNNRQTCLSITGQECMTSYQDAQGSRAVPVVMQQCGFLGNPTGSIVSGVCYPTMTRNDGVPLTLHPAGNGVDLAAAQAIDCALQPPLATPECSSSAAQGNTYCMHCDQGGNRLSCVALGVECTTSYNGAQVTVQMCSSLATSDGSAGSGGCSKLIALPAGGLFAFYTGMSTLPTTTCPTACTDGTKSGNTYCAMCDPSNNRQACLTSNSQECMTSYQDTQGITVPVVMRQCVVLGTPVGSMTGACYSAINRIDGVMLTLHPEGNGVNLEAALATNCTQELPPGTLDCSSSAAQGNAYCIHCDGGGNRLSCVASGVECTTTYDGNTVIVQLCSSLATSDGSAGSGGCSKIIALPTGGLFAFYSAMSSLPTATCPTACTDATKTGNTYCAMCDPSKNRQTCLTSNSQECMTSYQNTQSITVPVVMRQCEDLGTPVGSMTGACYPAINRIDGVMLTLHPEGNGVNLEAALATNCTQQPPPGTPECSSSAAQVNSYCMHCDQGGNRLSCVALGGVECTTTYNGTQVTLQLCSSLATSGSSADAGGCFKLIALPSGGLFALYHFQPGTTCPTACTDVTKSGNTYCAMCDPSNNRQTCLTSNSQECMTSYQNTQGITVPVVMRQCVAQGIPVGIMTGACYPAINLIDGATTMMLTLHPEGNGVNLAAALATNCSLKDACVNIYCGPFGTCTRGVCSCNKGWYGKLCTSYPGMDVDQCTAVGECGPCNVCDNTTDACVADTTQNGNPCAPGRTCASGVCADECHGVAAGQPCTMSSGGPDSEFRSPGKCDCTGVCLSDTVQQTCSLSLPGASTMLKASLHQEQEQTASASEQCDLLQRRIIVNVQASMPLLLRAMAGGEELAPLVPNDPSISVATGCGDDAELRRYQHEHASISRPCHEVLFTWPQTREDVGGVAWVRVKKVVPKDACNPSGGSVTGWIPTVDVTRVGWGGKYLPFIVSFEGASQRGITCERQSCRKVINPDTSGTIPLYKRPCSTGTVAGSIPLDTIVSFTQDVHFSECSDSDGDSSYAHVRREGAGAGGEPQEGWVQVSSAWFNNHLTACPKPTSGECFGLPLKGKTFSVSSCFGPRSVDGGSGDHSGIDLAVAEGSNVMAVAAGTVDTIDFQGCLPDGKGKWTSGGGNYVFIKHPGDLLTKYLHLKGVVPGLAVGSPVTRGQVIGYSGTSGMCNGLGEPTTAFHLHLTVKNQAYNVNPLGFLPQLKTASLLDANYKDCPSVELNADMASLCKGDSDGCWDAPGQVEGIVWPDTCKGQPDCKVSCSMGYRGGPVSVSCAADGTWCSAVGKCTQDDGTASGTGTKIYIAPSSQNGGPLCTKANANYALNEEGQMWNDFAVKYLVPALEGSGIFDRVVLANDECRTKDEEDPDGYNDAKYPAMKCRMDEFKALAGQDPGEWVYLAVHSDAAGECPNGHAPEEFCCFDGNTFKWMTVLYFGETRGSAALAKLFCQHVVDGYVKKNGYTPQKGSVCLQPHTLDTMRSMEENTNRLNGYPSILVEMGFHDSVADLTWWNAHRQGVADAFVTMFRARAGASGGGKTPLKPKTLTRYVFATPLPVFSEPCNRPENKVDTLAPCSKFLFVDKGSHAGACSGAPDGFMYLTILQGAAPPYSGSGQRYLQVFPGLDAVHAEDPCGTNAKTDYVVEFETKTWAVDPGTDCIPVVQLIPLTPGGNHELTGKTPTLGSTVSFSLQDTNVALSGFQVFMNPPPGESQCTDGWYLLKAKVTNVKAGETWTCPYDKWLDEDTKPDAWQHNFYTSQCTYTSTVVTECTRKQPCPDLCDKCSKSKCVAKCPSSKLCNPDTGACKVPPAVPTLTCPPGTNPVWTTSTTAQPGALQVTTCPDKNPPPPEGCLAAVMAAHPSWYFEFFDAKTPLDEFVAAQNAMGGEGRCIYRSQLEDGRSMARLIVPGSVAVESDCYPAIPQAVQFMVDPRNFMNDGYTYKGTVNPSKAPDHGCCLEDMQQGDSMDLDDSGIFQFMDAAYISPELMQAKGEVVGVVAKRLRNSYWTNWGNAPDADAIAARYAGDIWDAALSKGMHPLVLVGKMLQESGITSERYVGQLAKGITCPPSGLVPCDSLCTNCVGESCYGGCTKGYKCIPGDTAYNYCGIHAFTGDCNVYHGSGHAFQQGWTTPEAAMAGCAQFAIDNYVCVGQDTYYTQRWDLPGWNAKKSLAHQFSAGINAGHQKGEILASLVRAAGQALGRDLPGLKFKIPVYL